jgi:hypothetical protein
LNWARTPTGTIIKRRSGHFDPTAFRDRYREALRDLIEVKMKGLPVRPNQIASPPPVLDPMAALSGLASFREVPYAPPFTRRSAPIATLTGAMAGAAHPLWRPHFTETTARPLAPHPRRSDTQLKIEHLCLRAEPEPD